MPLVQLFLRGGRESINFTNQVIKGRFRIKHLYASFNVDNHGFYLAKINMRFLRTSNTDNNTAQNQYLLLPLDHQKAITNLDLDLSLGEFSMPKNFEVDVDLDSGHQVVLETETRQGQPFSFNANRGAPGWSDEDYVLNPPGGAYVSLGLNADKVLDGTLPNTTGVLDGPQPFMYCMILTLEYEDNSESARLGGYL